MSLQSGRKKRLAVGKVVTRDNAPSWVNWQKKKNDHVHSGDWISEHLYQLVSPALRALRSQGREWYDLLILEKAVSAVAPWIRALTDGSLPLNSSLSALSSLHSEPDLLRAPMKGSQLIISSLIWSSNTHRVQRPLPGLKQACTSPAHSSVASISETMGGKHQSRSCLIFMG